MVYLSCIFYKILEFIFETSITYIFLNKYNVHAISMLTSMLCIFDVSGSDPFQSLTNIIIHVDIFILKYSALLSID